MTALRNTAVQIGGTRIGNDPAGFMDGITPPPWSDEALCRGIDNPDIFYPERGSKTAAAKAICEECPLTAVCLQWSLDHDDRHGIYGGYTARERNKLRQPRTTHKAAEYDLVCANCNNRFRSPSHRRRYCSDQCKGKASYAKTKQKAAA